VACATEEDRVGDGDEGRAVINPLVVLIASQPGMAGRLLAEHADDGSGRCRRCSAGGQTGRYRWPCAIHRSATQAHEQRHAVPGTETGPDTTACDAPEELR
jgi:hypothetical protein